MVRAFRRALELNPDLPLTYKLYAQLEADQGLARDAMTRLVERAHSTDPELFAAQARTPAMTSAHGTRKHGTTEAR